MQDLGQASFKGISEAEAARRLAAKGFNELPAGGRIGFFTMLLDVGREPMFILLLGAGLLYLVLGNTTEALVLLFFVFVIIGITFYQERKTEHALDSLRDLSSPRARVIRDGEVKRIAGREIVRGDLLAVDEGDRVPADAVLLSCVNLFVDESLLTGESAPVRKAAGKPARKVCPPGGEGTPFIYSGTMVVKGKGFAMVLETGEATRMGGIGKSLESVSPEKTPLQKESGRLVRNFALAGLSFCAFVIVLYGVAGKGWLSGLLAGITLAMAILPEEIPVVLIVFLALGAWRISRNHVLTRRLAAIEILGAATTLCVDKTGTLTENRMSVGKLFANGVFLDIPERSGAVALPEGFHELVQYGILASQRDPFDPMEKAIADLGKKGVEPVRNLQDDWSLVHSYPLSEKMLALTQVWRPPESAEYVIAAKGAPEAIADLCHIDPQNASVIEKVAGEMAASGLRVLGVARSRLELVRLPDSPDGFNFKFVGLLGLADPVRPGVPDAIRECQSAGVRVLMITGDYPGTAGNIAARIGLKHDRAIVTGPELDAMTEDELGACIGAAGVFARVVPTQKLRLVRALKARGEIVAMTGDGVNDAPALKAAHIGVAMGGRGTDVAREAAALVLTDDDFSSIVRAVRLGRRIYDNIRKAVTYTFAVHTPIIGLTLIPLFFGWPLVLFPVHIVFLELIIDPACSIVFEAEPAESDVMRRPPRDPGAPLFGWQGLSFSIFQGLSVLAAVMVFFIFFFYRGYDEGSVRAMTFSTLIFANVGLIMANRSWTRTIITTLKSPNASFWWLLAGIAFVLALVLYVPALNRLFLFDRLALPELTASLAAGAFIIFWLEALKYLRRRRT